MKILIAGYGFVGQEIHRLFDYKTDVFEKRDDYLCPREVDNPNCELYSGGKIPNKLYNFCFVCTSTPMKNNGSCDWSSVEDVISKINADVFVVRSTIPPGATDGLEIVYDKNCVFTPEYVASTSPYPAPLGDIKARTFHILGGRKEPVKKVRRLFETLYPPTTLFLEMTALEAEITKLFENTAIANKVTLCQEFYEICRVYGVDYDTVKEAVFGADPRFNKWFTNVYEDKRGFSNSHCLKKDLNNLVSSCKDKGYSPDFIMDILRNNERWKND